MTRLRDRISFANVVSCLALFIALGGTAYANLTLAKNSVGSKQLKPNSVTGPKIKNGSIAAHDLNPNAISALFPVTPYSKTESDARYLRGTITVSKSFKLGEGSGESSSAQVSCPKGYQAIGGGVDTSNTLNVKVSASAPTFNGNRSLLAFGPGEHQAGPADGWYGAISTQGGRETSVLYDVVVAICSPIG